jgi:hypothetical protein
MAVWIQMMIRTHTELFGEKQSNDQDGSEETETGAEDAPVNPEAAEQEEAEPTR